MGKKVLTPLELVEQTAPGTPSTGVVAVYAKSDGKVYIKDDAGAETDLTASAGTDEGLFWMMGGF